MKLKCPGVLDSPGESPIERYTTLLAQVEEAKKELLAEKQRLNDAAQIIDGLLEKHQPVL